MQATKIVLSVLALLVGAAAGVTQIGGWNVTPAVTELLLSIGAALALFGVTPITVPPMLARVFGAISVVTIGAIAAHAGGDGSSSLAMKIAGFAAILLGLVAKFPVPQKAASGAVVLWLALALSLLGAPACPGCPGAVETVKDCSTEAASRLLDNVNTALATSDWRGGLADLVAKFGSCVIKKVVTQIAGDTTRAAHDADYALAVTRAKTWLNENP